MYLPTTYNSRWHVRTLCCVVSCPYLREHHIKSKIEKMIRYWIYGTSLVHKFLPHKIALSHVLVHKQCENGKLFG